MNVVVLIGRIATQPELKYTPSGVAVTNFRIAVDRRFKSQDGEKQADFIDIVAWKKSAEFACQYLTKGRVVAVQGRLEIRQWEQDGQKRSKAEVIADSVQGLDKPKQQAQGGDDDYDAFSEE